jgi:hypothetical protein
MALHRADSHLSTRAPRRAPALRGGFGASGSSSAVFTRRYRSTTTPTSGPSLNKRRILPFACRSLNDRVQLPPGAWGVTAHDHRLGLGKRNISARRVSRGQLGRAETCHPSLWCAKSSHKPWSSQVFGLKAGNTGRWRYGRPHVAHQSRELGERLDPTRWLSGYASGRIRGSPWQRLNLRPEPHGHGSFRPTREKSSAGPGPWLVSTCVPPSTDGAVYCSR